MKKIVFSAAVLLGVLTVEGVSTAQRWGHGPFRSVPAPTFDSGWILAEPDQSGAPFPIPHPVGTDIDSSLIAAEIRSPGSTEFSLNNWTADPNEVKVGRALFSAREVRVRIWVTR